MGKRSKLRIPKNRDRAQLLAIMKARAMVAAIAQRDVNEAETSHHVEWVFAEILGYDQFRHITHEHAVRGLGNTDHVDLAITLDEGSRAKPAILVEIKRVGVALAQKHIKQASAYAIQTGCNWVVLTNCREWMLYHIEFLQPPQPRLVEQWDLVKDDPATLLHKFRLISLACVRRGGHEEHWRKHQVLDERNMLNAMFGGASLKAIRRELRKTTGVSLAVEDILGALRRLLNESAIATLEDVAISFPKKRSESGPRAKPDVIKGRSTVTLKMLLEQGILNAPLPLHSTYKGKKLGARLLSDGSIECNGACFDNPSEAGNVAKEAVTGRPASTNGWTFWSYKDGRGIVQTLDDARKQGR